MLYLFFRATLLFGECTFDCDAGLDVGSGEGADVCVEPCESWALRDVVAWRHGECFAEIKGIEGIYLDTLYAFYTAACRLLTSITHTVCPTFHALPHPTPWKCGARVLIVSDGLSTFH